MSDEKPIQEIDGFFKSNYEITTYCNAKCPTCVRTQETPKLEHMDLDIFKITLGIHNPFVIELCGERGDPLMHPKLDDFIKIARDYLGPFETIEKTPTTLIYYDRQKKEKRSYLKSSIDIHTNGGLRNPEWFRKIVKNYNVGFHFGIDAPKNDLYRINVDTKLAIKNMLSASEETANIGDHTHLDQQWAFTIFSWNIKYIPEVLNIIKGHSYLYTYFRKNTHFDEKLNSEYIKDFINNSAEKINVRNYVFDDIL